MSIEDHAKEIKDSMFGEFITMKTTDPDTWICPFRKLPCTHKDGYPKVDIGESRMQVCLNCRLNEIINKIHLTNTILLDALKKNL